MKQIELKIGALVYVWTKDRSYCGIWHYGGQGCVGSAIHVKPNLVFKAEYIVPTTNKYVETMGFSDGTQLLRCFEEKSYAKHVYCYSEYVEYGTKYVECPERLSDYQVGVTLEIKDVMPNCDSDDYSPNVIEWFNELVNKAKEVIELEG